MNERTALQVIEHAHGSIEDFVIHLLEDCPNALDDAMPLQTRAKEAGVPLQVFSRLLSSGQFRELIRGEIVNRTYTLKAEERHIRAVKDVAIGAQRLVATAKGDLVHVDQNPADVMQAGRYLNEARGTPMDNKASGGFGGITITIGGQGGSDEIRTIEVASSEGAHRPRRAGELPPPGALGRSRVAGVSGRLPEPARDAGLGTLYGRDAEEADEDQAVADKVAGRPKADPGGRVDAGADIIPETAGARERRARWASLPSRPRPTPPEGGTNRTPSD